VAGFSSACFTFALRLLPHSRRVKSTAKHEDLIEMLPSEHTGHAPFSHHEQRVDGEADIMVAMERAKLDSL